MHINSGKKIYFLSDFHLGVPNHLSSLEREKKIVRFLDLAKQDAAMIFIVGDLFDFWFEYKKVIPKGFVRILGKLAEITDSGIPIEFFVGNHDMWMNGYFESELNIPVHYHHKTYQFNNKTFLIGHGDGLGPGDHGYKLLKKIFRNPICKKLFGIIPPVLGIGLANYSSHGSRSITGNSDEIFLGEDKEWLIQFCRAELQHTPIDYFIFGHRHLALDYPLNDKSRYINLGDWIKYFSYAVFDGNELTLNYYKE